MEPTRETNKKLAKWIENQRTKLQLYATDTGAKGERARIMIEKLNSIGVNVKESKPLVVRGFRSSKKWQPEFQNWAENITDEERQHLDDLKTLLSHWQDEPLIILREHMVRCLNVGDIDPSPECTRDAPKGNIRYQLSYIKVP